ncbi:HAD family hydrolase [Pseudomonas fulva]|uniref:HAD family hydrolase n=1 Tax=Pseudomonas fulva TaxID=47880 RepID=UPI00384A64C5
MKSMKYRTDNYATLVFDCDGVLLDSNKVKTDAFYKAALPYGDIAARKLANYHVQNGGVSRYKKFAYFLEEIVDSATITMTLEQLLGRYAEYVKSGLIDCEVAEGLHELRKNTTGSRWIIVSGGDQCELRDVFAQRELGQLFDGGIFGSPDTKENILSRELGRANIIQPAIFIGDSKYDYKAATEAGLDFVFMSEWSEVKDWEQWTESNKITTHKNISSLSTEITNKT